jgi:hypothetical protein
MGKKYNHPDKVWINQTTYNRELRTPSHSEIQIDWNSKPQRNTNSTELQATVKCKELGTPNHSEIQRALNPKPQQNINTTT